GLVLMVLDSVDVVVTVMIIMVL
ncbi:hypothetical protein L195_g062818, partial [Trifolium pratense]